MLKSCNKRILILESFNNPTPIQKIGLRHLNLKVESQKIKDRKKATLSATVKIDTVENLAALAEVLYSHLHNHIVFSFMNLLQK